MNPSSVTQQRLLDVSDMAGRLEEARRALVDGNMPVPSEIIGRWLDYIAGDLEHDPCTLYRSPRPQGDAGTAPAA